MVSGETSPDCKLGASSHPKGTDEKQICLYLLAHLSFLLSHCPMKKSWMWTPSRMFSSSSGQEACCGGFQFSSLHPNTSTKTSCRDDRAEMGGKINNIQYHVFIGLQDNQYMKATINTSLWELHTLPMRKRTRQRTRQSLAVAEVQCQTLFLPPLVSGTPIHLEC